MLTDNRKKKQNYQTSVFIFLLLGQKEEFAVRKGRINIGKRNLSFLETGREPSK